MILKQWIPSEELKGKIILQNKSSAYFLTNPLRVPSILSVFVADSFFPHEGAQGATMHKERPLKDTGHDRNSCEVPTATAMPLRVPSILCVFVRDCFFHRRHEVHKVCTNSLFTTLIYFNFTPIFVAQ